MVEKERKVENAEHEKNMNGKEEDKEDFRYRGLQRRAG
jgi:hypothetical protein